MVNYLCLLVYVHRPLTYFLFLSLAPSLSLFLSLYLSLYLSLNIEQ